MKISFDNKTVSCYREIYHQTKRVQETAESVVPDTNDDIGKIASVQTSVLLKSKDVTGRGVLVTGEAVAALVYITESEKNVSFVKLSKQFSIEYEVADINADAVAQIKLDIHNCEARIINPRKVSVTFELTGELSCYKRENIAIETVIDPAAAVKMHAKYEDAELICTKAVCEKTFTLSEQFVFPGGKPSPSQIVMQKANFNLIDSQLIGSKLIVKGNMELCVCYLSEEVNYPVKAEFSTAFSQIIDMGDEEMESCSAMVEISSIYYDIINTINGEKALEAEIHAILQIAARNRQQIKYVSDVYSNLMPVECSRLNRSIMGVSSTQQIKIIADERINVVDDCADVLSVFPSLSQLSFQPDKICAAINLDIIYRTKGGLLSAVRRLMSVSGDCAKASDRLISSNLTDIYLRPDGPSIDAHAAVEVKYQCTQTVEFTRVASVELDEENAFDFSSFPAVTLVRADGDQLWELAKFYHSSVEQISAANNIEDGIDGKLLLIPKAI